MSINLEMLEVLKELALLPNKKRPASLWEKVDQVIEKAETSQKVVAGKKEFFFQFKKGGWNSVWAVTIDEAKGLAFDLYGGVGTILYDTVKTVEGHESEYNMLLSNFD